MSLSALEESVLEFDFDAAFTVYMQQKYRRPEDLDSRAAVEDQLAKFYASVTPGASFVAPEIGRDAHTTGTFVVCLGGYPSSQGGTGGLLEEHDDATVATCKRPVWNMFAAMVGASNFHKFAVMNLFNVALTYKLWKHGSILVILEALPSAAIRHHAGLLARWLTLASGGRRIKLVTFSSKVDQHFKHYPDETSVLRNVGEFFGTETTGMVHLCCFTQWGMQSDLKKHRTKRLEAARKFIIALTGD